jgi:hypothetical protein
MADRDSNLKNIKKYIQAAKGREAAGEGSPTPHQNDFKAPKSADKESPGTCTSTTLGKLREQIKGRQDADRDNWKNKLRLLKLEHIKRTTPAAFEASGGYSMKIPAYSDETSNGLTKAILDFLNFSGHWAVRVNTQGQARVRRIPKFNILSGRVEQHEKVQWTKGTTKRGTPDITAIVDGQGVQLEIKVGRDQIRDEQTEQGHRITEAGGHFFVAQNMPLFLEWYYGTFRISEKK